MGNLVTFSLRTPNLDTVNDRFSDISDFITSVNGPGETQRTTIGDATVSCHGYTHSSQDVVLHLDQGVLDYANSSHSRQIAEEQYRILTIPKEQSDRLRWPLHLANSFEEAVIVGMIYTDRIHSLRRHPASFITSIYEAAHDAMRSPERRGHGFEQTIVHAPLLAQANALYIQSGNTSVWVDSASPQFERLQQENPSFSNKLTKILWQNASRK